VVLYQDMYLPRQIFKNEMPYQMRLVTD